MRRAGPSDVEFSANNKNLLRQSSTHEQDSPFVKLKLIELLPEIIRHPHAYLTSGQIGNNVVSLGGTRVSFASYEFIVQLRKQE
jgi:hypothetical protein